MKSVLWISLATVVLLVVVAVCSFNRGPNLSLYEGRVNSGVTRMDAQWVLVTRQKGNPNIVAKHAFRILFKTYYRYADKRERQKFAVPKARWPVEAINAANMNDWEGGYALPVSERFPNPQSGEVRLEKWEYGTVAEILHKGSYTDEPATVAKLVEFIRVNGYRIVGEHEEEYLKGPGMFFRGNPDGYMRIIRYRVEKADQPLVSH